MHLINDVVFSEYLNLPERIALDQCFIARNAFRGCEDPLYLEDCTDTNGSHIYTKGQPIEPLDKYTKENITKAIDSLGDIVVSIKTAAEDRYKRHMCNICWQKPADPILTDIKKILVQYESIPIKLSEYFETSWKNVTRQRALIALYADCDTQFDALQMWSVENTDLLPNETIQAYQAAADKLITDFVDTNQFCK